MAKLDEYWGQIQQSESFQDLDDAQKEKVRSRLFDHYIQKSPTYQGLPLTQRNQVVKHFNDTTKIEPSGMMDDIERRGKKIVKAVQPAIQKGKEIVQGIPDVVKKGVDAIGIDPSKIGSDLSMMAEQSAEIPGAKAFAQSFSAVGDYIGEKIEPNFDKPTLTPFDMARAVGAGAVRTVGDFIAGMIPETNIGAAGVFLADPVLKYAGTTFLGKEMTLPWKPKTGLSSAATDIGSDFEKIITKRRIENNARQAREGGEPKPLEVLAHKEQTLKAQDEVQQYQDWLEQVDKISPSGGQPAGDLYPEAKVNVSQLRDMAKERLDKLQSEPVRVESLSNAEDELHGYYRRRIDKMKVYMMPEASIPRETQGLLPGGPEPAGLLKSGETPKPPPGRSVLTPPAPLTPAPQAAPVEALGNGMPAKQVMAKAYSAYYPGESKQAIQIRVGAALKAFGFKPTESLSDAHLNVLERFMEQEHSDYMASQEKAKPASTAHLKEKGLDPVEVQIEAKRLHAKHETNRQGASHYEQAIRENGGIAQDPALKEEFLRNVPVHLRGKTTPDAMAQSLFEAGLQEDASSSTMYQRLSNRQSAGRSRPVNDFMAEAEHNIENEAYQKAGFQPESLPGMPDASMPKTGLSQTEGQVSDEALMEGFTNPDLTKQSTFDVITRTWKAIGEKGQIGGDVDPVRQAAIEAGIKELVDRAMAMGYQTTQDILLYAARNAPKELQDSLRKSLAPTLSPFDSHAYKEMDEARKGNATAKKSMMDAAQRGYFQQKADMIKGTYKKFKANQQVLIFKDGDEGLMRLQNDLFIHDNYRKFSKDELAAQRWYIEGKAPKLESLTAQGVQEDTAKRWLELAKNPTENMKSARAATQTFEDEYYDVLTEFYDKVGYVDDHVTRRWKQDREYLDWEGKTLGNKPNFTKGRKLLTQADGIDAGYEPVSYDIRDDLRASNNARVNVLSRIHAYQKLGASFGPEGTPAIIDESGDEMTQARNAKITPHTGQAPNSWMRFEHVPLLKGLAINPYYKSAVEFMMSRPFKGAVPEVLDFLAASTKATKLYGFFHGYTLGEMLASGVSYRDVFSFNKNRNVMYRGLQYAAKAMAADMEGKPLSKNPAKAVGELYQSFMSGHGVLANRPLALDMAEHGFKFGSADEDMHGILKKFLVKTEDFLKKRIGATPAKALTALPRGAVDIQEKALWAYIRPISSMLVYETNLKDAILEFNLKAAEGKQMPVDQIKSALVNQTSKEMGGISYARLMIQPRTQQVLQWAMLAPGWTIGRALMGASVLEKGPEGRQARKQMAKLFVGWFMASNMVNYAQTKKHLGKGRYMWENPEGYRNQAFLSKEKDGSTKYLQLSKALTEIYDDIDHPMRTAAYKLSPPVQAAAKVMNWATAKAYYPGAEPENPLVAAAHAYQPMITAGNSAYGGLPVKSGPSKNKVEAILDEYYKGGMKNAALFQEAMQVGTEQGYDVGKLDRAVRAARTSKERKALLR